MLNHVEEGNISSIKSSTIGDQNHNHVLQIGESIRQRVRERESYCLSRQQGKWRRRYHQEQPKTLELTTLKLTLQIAFAFLTSQVSRFLDSRSPFFFPSIIDYNKWGKQTLIFSERERDFEIYESFCFEFDWRLATILFCLLLLRWDPTQTEF